jgi:hypothetical protein
LTVAVSTGPWGAQARFLAEEIRRKANEALGSEVDKVTIVVRDDPTKHVVAQGLGSLDRR